MTFEVAHVYIYFINHVRLTVLHSKGAEGSIVPPATPLFLKLWITPHLRAKE
jgi:hypothetical protein